MHMAVAGATRSPSSSRISPAAKAARRPMFTCGSYRCDHAAQELDLCQINDRRSVGQPERTHGYHQLMSSC